MKKNKNDIIPKSGIKVEEEDVSVLDFHQIKKIVTDKNLTPEFLEFLLLKAAKKGVIRDIELFWPMAIAYKLHQTMEQAFIICTRECHLAIIDFMMSRFVENPALIDLTYITAVESGHPEVVEYFLNHGCNIHLNNDKLLINCCEAGDYPDVLQLMVNRGINVWRHYHRAYDICLANGHSKSASFLISYSALNPPENKKVEPKDCYQIMFTETKGSDEEGVLESDLSDNSLNYDLSDDNIDIYTNIKTDKTNHEV